MTAPIPFPEKSGNFSVGMVAVGVKMSCHSIPLNRVIVALALDKKDLGGVPELIGTPVAFASSSQPEAP